MRAILQEQFKNLIMSLYSFLKLCLWCKNDTFMVEFWYEL